MSLRRHLRKRCEDQQKLLQLHNRLPGSEISHPEPDARYLPVRLSNENHSQAQAWFDVDAWLTQMSLHLPAIPWKEVPVDYLANWLARLGLNFYFAETVWSVEAITPAVADLPPAALLLSADPVHCGAWSGRKRPLSDTAPRASQPGLFRTRCSSAWDAASSACRS